jgi:hypothetical protein
MPPGEPIQPPLRSGGKRQVRKPTANRKLGRPFWTLVRGKRVTIVEGPLWVVNRVDFAMSAKGPLTL